MSDKLRDIKDTASDAVEIIRELGTPEVQASLERIRETAKVAKEIIDSFKDPAMVANIENMGKIAESFERTSGKVEATVSELKSSGVLEEVKGAVGSAKSAMDSFGGSGGSGQTMDALKEMLQSITALTEELRQLVVSSKKDGIIRNVEETIHDTREIF